MSDHPEASNGLFKALLMFTLTFTVAGVTSAADGWDAIPLVPNSDLAFKVTRGAATCFTTTTAIRGDWLIKVVLSGELTEESEIIVFRGTAKEPELPAGPVTVKRKTCLCVPVPTLDRPSVCLRLDDLGLEEAEVVLTNVVLSGLRLKEGDPCELEPDPDPTP